MTVLPGSRWLDILYVTTLLNSIKVSAKYATHVTYMILYFYIVICSEKF